MTISVAPPECHEGNPFTASQKGRVAPSATGSQRGLEISIPTALGPCRLAWQTRLVTELNVSDSISVGVTPNQLYALVSDVTRMGEWSPICRACWWDEGAGPHVGSWFTGRNQTPERTWETRCQVVVATPGREFAFEVNNGWVYWGYTFEPENGCTRLTESWKFLPAGIAGFRERFGAQADAEIEMRRLAAKTGIPATLAAIKTAAEAAG
jgi:Polyketide cyclase / dehydrase and lipid transport